MHTQCTYYDSFSASGKIYIVLEQEKEQLVVSLQLVDQHLLQHVIRKTDDLQGLNIAQCERGDLSIRNPLLRGLVGLGTQYLDALLDYFFAALLGNTHYNNYCSKQRMNYQALYEAKSTDYDELSQQYTEFEEQSNLIINDLEEELKELKRKNDSLTREISEQRVILI